MNKIIFNKTWALAFLLGLFSAMIIVPANLQAQAGGAQISWDDDDDEEEETGDLPKVEDVVIYVDGEEFSLREDLEFEKNKVLSVQVRFLRPGSWIEVHLEKAGMKLSKTRYQANEKGELDLEVKTGKKKIQGSAKVFYTPNGAARMDRQVKVRVI